MSNLNKPVEELVTELADTVASLTQYMNTEDILFTLDDIAEKMKLRCEADPSTYAVDQYWWRNLKAISQWFKNRRKFTLVADEFGYQYMIPEHKKDEWGR